MTTSESDIAFAADRSTLCSAKPIPTITRTSAGGSHQRVERHQRGDGRVTFHPTRWEDMPTQAHVVEALRALPVRAWRGVTVTETRGGKDLSDQRRLA